MESYFESLTNIKDFENSNSELSAGIPASKENNEFFSIISHNIKNPFTTLLGFSDLLFEDYEQLDDEERKFYLNEILKSAHFTNKYLERFFEWIYYKTGKVKINIENLDLKEQINNSIKLITQKLNTRNPIFNCEQQIYVKADSESFNKILYYILENAVIHSGNSEKVLISCIIDEFNESAKIIIKDFGVGISEQQMSKLFKVNEDITLNSANRIKGTGLGLILADLLLKINNGKIELKSKLNEGVEVIIELPLAKLI
ncbi:MAG: HAMP domain-containing histidine kinase [Ignavibacteriae bacterium]|nr:HAMP domain-containing histidine kinase [Ignavibacteriota bacterium]